MDGKHKEIMAKLPKSGERQVCVSAGGAQIHLEVFGAEAWCLGWHEEVHGSPAATLLVASLIVTSSSSSATNPMKYKVASFPVPGEMLPKLPCS